MFPSYEAGQGGGQVVGRGGDRLLRLAVGGKCASRWQPPGPYLSGQALDSRAWLRIEVSGEEFTELLVPKGGFVPLSAERVEAHQTGVRFFVERVFGQRLPKGFDARTVFAALLVEPGKLQEQRVVQLP